MNSADVAVVIPTRGDVDMRAIRESFDGFGFADGYFWNNAGESEDLSVYGRYAAIERVSAPVIFTQDDDCILPPESIAALLAAYQPGHITANMPARFREHYPDSCLVGFGAVFDRELPERAFDRFSWNAPLDQYEALGGPFWQRTCDVVFTTLTPRTLVDVPVEILPYAHDASRMWKQPEHFGERQRMLALARQVRDAVTA